MTTEQIAADIERGKEIKTTIGQLTTELKAIEKRLESAALNAPHEPLVGADREGKQARLASPLHILPIRFESDMLVGFIDNGSVLDDKLRQHLTGPEHLALLKPVIGHERRIADGKKFRALVRQTIEDQARALKLIDLLRSRDKDNVPKSRTVIAWDDIAPL